MGNKGTVGFYFDTALSSVVDKLILGRIRDVTHWCYISEVQVICGSGMFWSDCLGFAMIMFVTVSQ